MTFNDELNALGVRYPAITKRTNGGKAFGRRRLATLAILLRNEGFTATQVAPHIASVLHLEAEDERVIRIADTILSFWPGA